MIGLITWTSVQVEQVSEKINKQSIHGEKLMIAPLEFEDGSNLPWHSHGNNS